jgi:hypothetical protein
MPAETMIVKNFGTGKRVEYTVEYEPDAPLPGTERVLISLALGEGKTIGAVWRGTPDEIRWECTGERIVE